MQEDRRPPVDQWHVPNLQKEGLSRRFQELIKGRKPATILAHDDRDMHNMRAYWRVSNTFDVMRGIKTYLQQLGKFDFAPFVYASGRKYEGEYVVARKGNFGEFIKRHRPIRIPQFNDRVKRLIENLGLEHANIAEATAMLFALQGISSEDPDVPEAAAKAKVGQELPEVAILLGKLFGYRNCDTRYYVETRFGLKQKDPYEDGEIKAVYDKEFDSTNCVLCPSCFRKAVARGETVVQRRLTPEELKMFQPSREFDK